ncbi:MAG: hypothetical protein EZS28_008306 [Streblomastix strix]|uniref:Uncharacterized protein n=1 Tax=Streblomastix strix TaxID=222440 RepID=A0A5J4WMZ2_9EUKA|nr:MAG: hypothetical protein EZS28_008306 [Streblomastix strix]
MDRTTAFQQQAGNDGIEQMENSITDKLQLMRTGCYPSSIETDLTDYIAHESRQDKDLNRQLSQDEQVYTKDRIHFLDPKPEFQIVYQGLLEREITPFEETFYRRPQINWRLCYPWMHFQQDQTYNIEYSAVTSRIIWQWRSMGFQYAGSTSLRYFSQRYPQYYDHSEKYEKIKQIVRLQLQWKGQAKHSSRNCDKLQQLTYFQERARRLQYQVI